MAEGKIQSDQVEVPALDLNDLQDVAVPSPSPGEGLVWNGSNWVPGAVGASPGDFESLITWGDGTLLGSIGGYTGVSYWDISGDVPADVRYVWLWCHLHANTGGGGGTGGWFESYLLLGQSSSELFARCGTGQEISGSGTQAKHDDTLFVAISSSRRLYRQSVQFQSSGTSVGTTWSVYLVGYAL